MDPYEVRQEAQRIIGEDRVPTDVLQEIVDQFGDPPPSVMETYEYAINQPQGFYELEWVGGGVVWAGYARDPLQALDLWSDTTEMARYSDIVRDENLGDDERGVIGIDDGGNVYGISSNGWVTAIRVAGVEVSKNDLEAALDELQEREEEDYEVIKQENEEAAEQHIVHVLRRLRARLTIG